MRFRTQPIWDTCLSWVRTLISAWAPSKLMKRDYSPESLSTVSSQGVMMLYLSSILNLLRRKTVHNFKTLFSRYVRHNHHFLLLSHVQKTVPLARQVLWNHYKRKRRSSGTCRDFLWSVLHSLYAQSACPFSPHLFVLCGNLWQTEEGSEGNSKTETSTMTHQPFSPFSQKRSLSGLHQKNLIKTPVSIFQFHFTNMATVYTIIFVYYLYQERSKFWLERRIWVTLGCYGEEGERQGLPWRSSS